MATNVPLVLKRLDLSNFKGLAKAWFKLFQLLNRAACHSGSVPQTKSKRTRVIYSRYTLPQGQIAI